MSCQTPTSSYLVSHNSSSYLTFPLAHCGLPTEITSVLPQSLYLYCSPLPPRMLISLVLAWLAISNPSGLSVSVNFLRSSLTAFFTLLLFPVLFNS